MRNFLKTLFQAAFLKSLKATMVLQEKLKFQTLENATLHGISLELKKKIRYLETTMDTKLSWKPNIEERVEQASRALYAYGRIGREEMEYIARDHFVVVLHGDCTTQSFKRSFDMVDGNWIENLSIRARTHTNNGRSLDDHVFPLSEHDILGLTNHARS